MSIEIELSDILIIDDSITQAKTAEEYIKAAGHMVRVGHTLAEANQLFEERIPDLLLLDVQLPDGDGIEKLPEFKRKYPDTVVVVFTAFGSVDRALTAVQNGASDFLEKPVSKDRLVTTVRNALENRKLNQIAGHFTHVEPKDQFYDFIGSSLAMQSVYKIIEAASPSTAAVFITGESGTGKELAASAIHHASTRKAQPFIAVNCAAIPKELIESELFGHVKGAFTGAISTRDGAATQADGGTLFLDEICEMNFDLQAKLLRFLQTGTIKRVGAAKNESVDVRIVCATNRSPWNEVQEGRFREDLYYRLHVIPLHLPPLRDRDDDVILIAQFLLEKIVEEENKSLKSFDDAVKKIFKRYRWPGNVRELQNVIRNIVVLHDGELVEPDFLPHPISKLIGDASLDSVKTDNNDVRQKDNKDANTASRIKTLEEVERETIIYALERFNGDVLQTANALDITTKNLEAKIEKWGLHKKSPEKIAMPSN